MANKMTSLIIWLYVFSLDLVISQIYSSGLSEAEGVVFAGEQFCNSSVTSTFKTSCINCGINTYASCPPGTKQVSTPQGVMCFYVTKVLSTSIRLSGCQHVCEVTSDVRECCEGRWGIDCQECPGGSQSPCSNRGTCMEGLSGNGTCQCEPNFNGTACELCISGHYGEDCSQTCSCVHGVCRDGIHGDGACACFSGYKGRLCDTVIPTCASVHCPKFARCVDREDGHGPGCECLPGYEPHGSSYACQAINPCLGNHECDANAKCMQVGANQYSCMCRIGYQGDGFVCTAIDSCQDNNGGCPLGTTQCIYQRPGENTCECLPGYENYRTDVGCDLIDLCTQNASLCHEHANCSTVGPGDVECICDPGYIGDGVECFGNIIQRIEELQASDPDLKGSLGRALSLMKNSYFEALTEHGPFTVFVPKDSGMSRFPNGHMVMWTIRKPEDGRRILREHMLATQMSVEEMNNASTLYNLEGTSARLFYKKGVLNYKLDSSTGRAAVLKKDILAVNGMIHIVDKLLIKPPTIETDSLTLLGQTILLQPAYDQFETLMKHVGIYEMLQDELTSYTVFAPNNDAWTKLPEGTIQYLMSEEGKQKLKAILLSHIVQPPVIRATDLVNMHRFVSLANTATTVSVSLYGQILLNDKVAVTQTDMVVKNGVIHHVNELILPDVLEPLLPHRCDITTHRLVKGPCGPCHSKLRCAKTDDEPMNVPGLTCRYWVNVGKENGGYLPLSGCRQMCNRTYTVPKCCENFYGHECRPCPGGFQNPCFGRGQCSDGYDRSGSCACDSKYSGATCEYCSYRRGYGPHCNLTCNCLHGRCDNKATETGGNCLPNTCYRGYMGPKCDIQKKKCYRKLRCHAHAECIQVDPAPRMIPITGRFNRFTKRIFKKMRRQSLSFCRCKQGYTGSGLSCVEIDPCQQPDRGGCHVQAKCIKGAPGQSSCVCDRGYVGDGTYCYPATTCSSYQHCHESASCKYSGNGRYLCICNNGFHGNGTDCAMENICQDNNGGCHPKATCTAVGPGESNCTCPLDMAGDGYTCYGTVEYEVNNHPRLSQLEQLLERISTSDNLLSDLESTYTLLAPNNSALEEFIDLAPDRFFEDEGNLLILLGFHILPAGVSFEELQTTYSGQTIFPLADEINFSLNVTAVGEDVYINDAQIIVADLPALNGYIHIIDKVLEPYPITMASQTLGEMLPQYSEFSISYNYLQAYEMLETIEAMDEYTVFLPVDEAWSQFDKPVNRRLLMYLVIGEDLMSWQVPEEGLTKDSLLGNSENHRLMLTPSEDQKIFVNGAQVILPNLMTASGVVQGINQVLDTDLLHCDSTVRDTIMGPCGPCDGDLRCPQDYSREEPAITVEGNCTYRVRGLTLRDIEGCQTLCHRTLKVKDCCEGYYGSDCQECPGDVVPCSSHGNCSDGKHGLGECSCENGYEGTGCERCISEVCMKDPCSIDNGGCHKYATCDVGNSSEVTCRCMSGYHGNGYVCMMKMCAINNGSCPTAANCSTDEDGLVICTCPDGSNPTDGSTCDQPTNPCDTSNGGCADNATCEIAGPDEQQVLCTCNTGFVGNGTMCNKDVWSAMKSIPQISVFLKIIKSKKTILDGNRTLLDLLKHTLEPVTVFAPVDDGLQAVTDYDRYNVLKYISNNKTELYDTQGAVIVRKALDGSELNITSHNDNHKITFVVNGVPVEEANVPAVNGVIHLISSAFIEQQQKLVNNPPAKSNHFGLITAAIIGSIGILLLVIFAVWKARHKAQVVLDRIRNSSISGLSFTRYAPEKFDVVRFRPATGEFAETTPRPVTPSTSAGALQKVVPAADKELNNPNYFCNPVFSQLPEGDEDQLIFQ